MTRLLITGTGRCGTTWMQACMAATGIPTRGEVRPKPFDNNRGSWLIEVSWRCGPFTPWPDTYVAHLVRHPLDTIRSRVDRGTFERPPGTPLRRLAEQHVPAMTGTTSPVERAALHWVGWNRLIAADERIRLEDVTVDTVNRLAAIVDPTVAKLDGLPANRWRTGIDDADRWQRSPDLTWDQVAHIPGLIDLAAEYGYSPDDGR